MIRYILSNALSPMRNRSKVVIYIFDRRFVQGRLAKSPPGDNQAFGGQKGQKVTFSKSERGKTKNPLVLAPKVLELSLFVPGVLKMSLLSPFVSNGQNVSVCLFLSLILAKCLFLSPTLANCLFFVFFCLFLSSGAGRLSGRPWQLVPTADPGGGPSKAA